MYTYAFSSISQVETIGDCYVAATGLPEPRDDHAVVMAKFARDCMHKMLDLVHKLEVVLGYVRTTVSILN